MYQSAAAAPSPVLGNIPPNDGMPGGPIPPGFFQELTGEVEAGKQVVCPKASDSVPAKLIRLSHSGGRALGVLARLLTPASTLGVVQGAKPGPSLGASRAKTSPVHFCDPPSPQHGLARRMGGQYPGYVWSSGVTALAARTASTSQSQQHDGTPQSVQAVIELMPCNCSLLCHRDTQAAPGPRSEWETSLREEFLGHSHCCPIPWIPRDNKVDKAGWATGVGGHREGLPPPLSASTSCHSRLTRSCHAGHPNMGGSMQRMNPPRGMGPMGPGPQNVQVKDNPPSLETVLRHQEKLHLPTEPGQSKLNASEQRPQKEMEGS
ncbi:hypothetical protein J1605_012554 [Eschrichtius robustus]|uniref:Uncharacterized protein n=1 Tax=Eschrichtius robustus TaxID=9764 RepID=A0AB34GMJ5_ESCRO|nr:hypothetical protein J1605_012554 [Eschrichtius robustus]